MPGVPKDLYHRFGFALMEFLEPLMGAAQDALRHGQPKASRHYWSGWKDCSKAVRDVIIAESREARMLDDVLDATVQAEVSVATRSLEAKLKTTQRRVTELEDLYTARGRALESAQNRIEALCSKVEALKEENEALRTSLYDATTGQDAEANENTMVRARIEMTGVAA